MSYSKYTDEELLETYSTMMEYSQKADEEVSAELAKRGGLDVVKDRVEENNAVPKEIKKLKKKIFEEYKKNPDREYVKRSIRSKLLSVGELELLINNTIESIDLFNQDRIIDSRTVMGGTVGGIIATLLGSGIWWYSLVITGKMLFILIPVISILAYVIIGYFTKQSRKNTFVFLVTFAATFLSILMGTVCYRFLGDVF
jgi:hypothetical protein